MTDIINKLRQRIIRLEKDSFGNLQIRSIGGGKRTLSKNDISINNDFIFNKYYTTTSNAKIFTTNECKAKTIVSVQGFWGSGTTAYIDLLREFDNTTVFGPNDLETLNYTDIDQFEMLFIVNSGILLYHKLLNLDLFRIDAYVKKSIFTIKSALLTINKDPRITSNAIGLFNQMFFTIFEIVGAEVYDDNKLPPVSFYHEKCIIKNDNKFFYYRIRENMTDKSIQSAVWNFCINLFDSFRSKDFLILDNLTHVAQGSCFLDKNLNYGHDLDLFGLKNLKQIVVYRDPRDQFCEAFRWSLYAEWGNDDVNNAYKWIDDCENYKTILANYKINHPNRICVRFEDLVYDYENSVDKICKFLEIDKVHHTNKLKHFDYKVSKKNIGIYRDFFDQNIINNIYKNFKEYCYE